MKKVILLLSVVALSLSSCSTYYAYTSRKVEIIKQDITATPTIVDVKADYGKRIEATSSRSKSLEQAKQEAKYLAITQNNCDIIVDPIYKIEYEGKRYRVTLSGFAGFFVNQRTFYEDIKLLHDIDKEDLEKYLILHNPEVLEYLYKDTESTSGGGETINIYHNDPKSSETHAHTPAPVQAPAHTHTAAPAQVGNENTTQATTETTTTANTTTTTSTSTKSSNKQASGSKQSSSKKQSSGKKQNSGKKSSVRVRR